MTSEGPARQNQRRLRSHLPRKLTSAVIKPARKSSDITPHPFAKFWLGPTGHGFAISNRRKRAKITTLHPTASQPARGKTWSRAIPVWCCQANQPNPATGKARISSSTTHPGSCNLRISSARVQIQTPAKKERKTKNRNRATLVNCPRANNQTSPRREPTVPGATGERPVPSPRAKNTINLSILTGSQRSTYRRDRARDCATNTPPQSKRSEAQPPIWQLQQIARSRYVP